MRLNRTAAVAALTAMAILAPVAPALAANPIRASFREGKADFHDKELSLTYAFGPGSIDFALFDGMSFGVAADQIFSPQNWYYRATYRVVDNAEAGLNIALNAGALHSREQLAGDTYLPPVWGWQGGLLVSLLTESGLTFRGGFQLYDTEWGAPDGQRFLFTPEIAYRFSLVEVTLVPNWPLSLDNWTWVGLRLRI